MLEENKAVMRRFYEEFVNAGNLAVAEEIIAPEAFEQTRVMMYAGLPDLRWIIEEMISEGDKVAERLTARGTHEGEFMGVAPTGKRVEFQGIVTVRIREGKISENRGMPDMLGLLQQLGAVPALQ